MRIYVTHCSATKNASLRGIEKKVTPDKLYTSSRIQRFMKKCEEKHVEWAIFSDKYGVWHKKVKNSWYEKDPDSVTDEELNELVVDFNKKLGRFDEIWFYYNPGRFHKTYRKLLNKTDLNVKKFRHLNEIVS